MNIVEPNRMFDTIPNPNKPTNIPVRLDITRFTFSTTAFIQLPPMNLVMNCILYMKHTQLSTFTYCIDVYKHTVLNAILKGSQ